jgi:hypothetical protein
VGTPVRKGWCSHPLIEGWQPLHVAQLQGWQPLHVAQLVNQCRGAVIPAQSSCDTRIGQGRRRQLVRKRADDVAWRERK